MIPLHRVKANSKVDVWDLGPQRPEAPAAPTEIDDKLKGHELALAKIEYEDAMELYTKGLRIFAAQKREFQDWHQRNGGPVRIELWGIDARHALELDPERYKLDLPKGIKPGKAQIAAEEMAKAEGLELAAARERDPNFGKQQGLSP